MYTIYQGSEVLEVTSYFEYIKLQANGKKVTSTAADYDFIYSRDSDKMYDKSLVHIADVGDDPPDLASEDQKLGREITDEQLERIEMGQAYTDLELALLEQGQKITDVELEALKNV